MKFFAYTLGDPTIPLPPPSPEDLVTMGAFVEEAQRAGVLIATGGLAPTSEGVQVAYDGHDYTITDGPFAEAKELIGGWALLDVTSKEEAIDWTKRFLAKVGRGESRIRQVFGPDDFGPAGG